jgi:drug/metabolite transporter (DMT)-like permease
VGVALALGSAVAFGVSDFVAGVVSRRAGFWAVAFLGKVAALAAVCLVAAAAPAAATGRDVAWGALSGLAAAVGVVLLYRGLSRGEMHAVAPVSALGATAVPIVVGVLGGERPPLPGWIGFGLALLAVWLLARPSGERFRAGRAVLDGAASGVGFGLVYVAVGQMSDAAGAWPLAAGEAVAVLVIAAAALLAGAVRRPSVRSLPSLRGPLAGALAVGLLLAAAVVSYQAAVRTELVAVAGVVASLYPAVTVLLAAAVLGERPDAGRRVGLLLAVVATALMALGPR